LGGGGGGWVGGGTDPFPFFPLLSLHPRTIFCSVEQKEPRRSPRIFLFFGLSVFPPPAQRERCRLFIEGPLLFPPPNERVNVFVPFFGPSFFRHGGHGFLNGAGVWPLPFFPPFPEKPQPFDLPSPLGSYGSLPKLFSPFSPLPL